MDRGMTPDDEIQGHDEARHGVAELSLACDRCRRRKVKCSRGQPCQQCTATGVSCSYNLGQKPRIRRQRVRVSNDLESNVEHIAKTVDELKSMMEDINMACPSPENQAPAPQPPAVAASRVSAPASPQPSPASVQTLGVTSARSPRVPQTEYSGESSLFAHALFATAFLQNAVGNSSSFQITAEMGPVMRTLSSITEAQKQTTESIDVLFPHARSLEEGRKPRAFPTPPADKVFACLRLAQETNDLQAMWIMEFESLGHFTEYVIKVCSPGSSSEEELIIVNAGLYWLFLECASIVEDEVIMLDYEAQAMMCRDNLETLLAHLGFHVSSTLDAAYALHMAATYCLQSLKASAAWGFVVTASHICQALGLHSAVSLYPQSPIQQRRKLRLFWAVYSTEKSVSLRIGRSSTFRDNDITVPRPQRNPGPDSLINRLFPIWVECGFLQGRVYDEVYSPGAFMQPEQVRYARARALISEIREVMEAEDAIEREIETQYTTTDQPILSQLSWRSDRISCLSMLTLLYRSLPPAGFTKSSFSSDCIITARRALEEHQSCLTLLEGQDTKTSYLDLFIDWSMLQSPFVPFTILFCYVIESSSANDLRALRKFLDTGEGAPYTSRHASTRNQLRLFQALYSVAVRYISIKQASSSSEGGHLIVNGRSLDGSPVGVTVGQFVGDTMDFNTTSGELHQSGTEAAVPQQGEGHFFTNQGLQFDSSGGLLANWFASSQQLMMMMENT